MNTGIQTIKNRIKKIARKHGLVLIIQFGSSLDQNRINHPESDIDIGFLVKGKSACPLKQLIDLKYDLSIVFNVSEDKIDLVDLNRANSLIAYKITSDGISLYDSDGHQFNEFFLKTIRQKIDERDLYDIQNEILKKKVGSYAG